MFLALGRHSMRSDRTLALAFLICLIVSLSVSSASAQRPALPRGFYFGQAPPGDAPVLFAPDVLGFNGGYHSTIAFSPGRRAAYWTQMSMDAWTTRMEGDSWTVPRRVTFGMAEDVTEVALAPSGNRAFFLSSESTVSDPEERERIWWVERRGDGWSEPRPMQDEIIAHPTHWDFSVALNNNLYFTSLATGVRGRGDVYVARFDGERYAEPTDIGPEINSDGDEICPFVSPDESFLIFSRSGPETSGLDLFVSFRNDNGTWSEAVSLGAPVNSERNEISPVISPDGEYLFFTSSRTRRMLVYWVDSAVIDRLRTDGGR